MVDVEYWGNTSKWHKPIYLIILYGSICVPAHVEHSLIPYPETNVIMPPPERGQNDLYVTQA